MTTDLWLASFLVRLGHNIVSVKKEGKRAKIVFNIDDEAWAAAKVSWLSSAEMDIKYTQEKIKDLIFQ